MTCFRCTPVFGRFMPWELAWQHLYKIPCQPSYRDLLGLSGACVLTCFVSTPFVGRFRARNIRLYAVQLLYVFLLRCSRVCVRVYIGHLLVKTRVSGTSVHG